MTEPRDLRSIARTLPAALLGALLVACAGPSAREAEPALSEAPPSADEPSAPAGDAGTHKADGVPLEPSPAQGTGAGAADPTTPGPAAFAVPAEDLAENEATAGPSTAVAHAAPNAPAGAAPPAPTSPKGDIPAESAGSAVGAMSTVMATLWDPTLHPQPGPDAPPPANEREALGLTPTNERSGGVVFGRDLRFLGRLRVEGVEGTLASGLRLVTGDGVRTLRGPGPRTVRACLEFALDEGAGDSLVSIDPDAAVRLAETFVDTLPGQRIVAADTLASRVAPEWKHYHSILVDDATFLALGSEGELHAGADLELWLFGKPWYEAAADRDRLLARVRFVHVCGTDSEPCRMRYDPARSQLPYPGFVEDRVVAPLEEGLAEVEEVAWLVALLRAMKVQGVDLEPLRASLADVADESETPRYLEVEVR